MPAESCGEIKASEQGMAVSGRYWLKPKETKIKSKSFLVAKLLLLLKLDGQVRYVCDDSLSNDQCNKGVKVSPEINCISAVRALWQCDLL